jgi:hypothetical protein
MPAIQGRLKAPGNSPPEEGKPRIFCVPCAMKMRAATMRRMLNRRGAHTVSRVAVFMKSSPKVGKAVIPELAACAANP